MIMRLDIVALCLLLNSFMCHAFGNQLCEKLCPCSEDNHASGGKVVNCESQRFVSPPLINTWPSHIYSLDFSYNNFSHLEQFQPSDVHYIYFSYNGIKTIDADAFSNFAELRGLDLSYNLIQSPHIDTFNGLKNLLCLNLSGNGIRKLPGGIFRDLSSLETLRLSHNLLTYISDDIFGDLNKLKLLDLSSSSVHTISPGAFHMISLEHLDLSNNDLALVPSEALRHAANLTILDLSENPITSLGSMSFYSIGQMKRLILHGMSKLEEVGPYSFAPLVQLEFLDLSGSVHLSKIDPKAFSSANVSLKAVHLRGCNLKWLNVETLPWCEVETLDLQGNAWMCDCKNVWMKECQLNPNLTVDLKCAGPERHRGKLLKDVDRSEFTCSPDEDYLNRQRSVRMLILVIGGLGVTAMITSAILFVKRKDIQEWWTHRQRRNGSVYYVKAHTNPLETMEYGR